MKAVFVDTNYWIALLSPGDELGAKARAAAIRLGPLVSLVTSDWILIEVMDYFSGEDPLLRELAVKLYQNLRKDPRVKILPVNRHDLESAIDLYRKHADKSWSVVDCLSLLSMRKLGITDALTYDHHFEQMGFTALLRD